MRDLKSSEVTVIMLEGSPGAHVSQITSEALILALEENKSVRFEFNGSVCTIDPDAIISDIVRRFRGVPQRGEEK